MRPRLRRPSLHVAAKTRDHTNHLVDAWWLFGQWAAVYDRVNSLPFAILEDQVARQVWAFPSNPKQVQNLPRDYHVDGHAVLDPIHRLEMALLNSAARFQCPEVNFYLPADTVVVDDPLNILDCLDGKRRDQPCASARSADGSGNWTIDRSKLLTQVHDHSSCEQVIVSPHSISLIDANSWLVYHQSMMLSLN